MQKVVFLEVFVKIGKNGNIHFIISWNVIVFVFFALAIYYFTLKFAKTLLKSYSWSTLGLAWFTSAWMSVRKVALCA